MVSGTVKNQITNGGLPICQYKELYTSPFVYLAKLLYWRCGCDVSFALAEQETVMKAVPICTRSLLLPRGPPALGGYTTHGGSPAAQG